MPINKSVHAVSRIREVFAEMSEESGLRDYSSIRGFAEFLGCSESVIRHVEKTGELSDRLARLIQTRTGVSADWLKSSPDSSDPIIGASGQPWCGENLDLFKLLPALKPMLVACPSTLPAAVGKLVETLLTDDFFKGEIEGLIAFLKILQTRGFYSKGGLAEQGHDSKLRHEQCRRSELPAPLEEAVELLLQTDGDLSESQLKSLNYLKSLEPSSHEDSRVGGLLEDYQRSRKRSHRSMAMISRRLSTPTD